MKFQSIKKVHSGSYIHRYDITYETEEGSDKIYEMISRNPSVQGMEDLQRKKADAVVMILHDESGERLLLNREFRMALGDFVYNFPAGLMEPGETPEETARRELKEETGLTLTAITDYMPISYSAVGFSNETNICIVGTAEGAIGRSDSAVEEIEAGWFTRKEIRELFEKGESFAARTQAYCYLWSNMPGKKRSK
ncbi:MAG: NUDIX hydrolase [Lachnospiraceae bacterium]|nr:NUDIX hydrolase [Lachnospiraceae bacterium]